MPRWWPAGALPPSRWWPAGLAPGLIDDVRLVHVARAPALPPVPALPHYPAPPVLPLNAPRVLRRQPHVHLPPTGRTPITRITTQPTGRTTPPTTPTLPPTGRTTSPASSTTRCRPPPGLEIPRATRPPSRSSRASSSSCSTPPARTWSSGDFLVRHYNTQNTIAHCPRRPGPSGSFAALFLQGYLDLNIRCEEQVESLLFELWDDGWEPATEHDLAKQKKLVESLMRAADCNG